MIRGKIFETGYRPQFSGHETFPLRYGWIKKAYDAVHIHKDDENNKNLFLAEDAIARFGVGKNMVSSIRHWCQAIGIIEEVAGKNQLTTTELGEKLFASDGWDPYMENPSSIWLIHWLLCSRPEKTTWHYAFNYFPNQTFDRENLLEELNKTAREREWTRISSSTIKRDVECFIRTYVPKPSTKKISFEEALESPLTELNLIKPIGKRDGFRFVYGPKSSLGNGIFLFALINFWQEFSSAKTLSFESIAHEPGSPGRVFLLDENDLADRLMQLDENSDGMIRWSETAGMKQILRDRDFDRGIKFSFLESDFFQRH
jgi:hypothetical protein